MKAWIIMGNGRIGRLRLIAYSVWYFLAILPIIIIQLTLWYQGQATAARVLDFVLILVTVPINIMFGIRRLHDMNRSGWWSVIQIPMSLVSPKAMFEPHGAGAISAIIDIAFV